MARMSSMGVAVWELERGDGAWENIQDVLRLALLAHERRLDDQDARVTDLVTKSTQNAEQVVKWRGLEGHVDALARAVNTMSEELKQRAQEEEERRQRLVESVTTAIETQLQTVFAQLGGVEEAHGKTMERLEWRMELIEEELGHVVDAVERKADVEALNAHKKTMEEALKQRCRKVAFDKEVLKVHQLLRAQQTTLTDRFQLLRSDLEEQIRAELHAKESSSQHREEQKEKSVGLIQQQQELRGELDDKLMSLKAELHHKLSAVKELTLVECGEQISRAQNETLLQVAGTIGQHAENMLKRVEEADVSKEVVLLRSEIDRHHQQLAGLAKQINSEAKEQNVLRELQPRLVALSETSQQSAEELRSDLCRLNQAVSIVQDHQKQLQTLVKNLQQHHESTRESLAKRCGDMEQQHLELATELRDAVKAKEKKTRHQMHLVADKLSEMDQIMKLVGKQLVQNTSQLQLLWTEQHELIGEADAFEAPMLLNASTGDGNTAGDGIKDGGVTTSHHRQLQETVEAKLRAYSDVLAPLQEPSPT